MRTRRCSFQVFFACAALPDLLSGSMQKAVPAKTAMPCLLCEQTENRLAPAYICIIDLRGGPSFCAGLNRKPLSDHGTPYA